MDQDISQYRFDNPSGLQLASVMPVRLPKGGDPFSDPFDITVLSSTLRGIRQGLVQHGTKNDVIRGRFDVWHVWYVRYLVIQEGQIFVCFSNSLYFLTEAEANSASEQICQKREAMNNPRPDMFLPQA